MGTRNVKVIAKDGTELASYEVKLDSERDGDFVEEAMRNAREDGLDMNEIDTFRPE